jgi:hypothetical protein
MPRSGRLPKQLQRMLDKLTDEDKLRKFRYAHNRDASSLEEAEIFVTEVARNLYNEGYDDWPEDDEELS